MTAFDAHRPPQQDLIDDCVHCGFCLPACPTYALWGEEMDSPRGRIQLMAQGLDGEPMTGSLVGHIDACLGCMACVTACPSGVRYDQLITATRAQVERRHTRSRWERAMRAGIFAMFPYRRRLGALRGPLRAYQRSGLERLVQRSGLAGRLPQPLRTMVSLLPPLGPVTELPERMPAVGERRGTVALLTGCVQQAFFSAVNAATARVLVAEGFDVVVPAAQGCCGALSEHSGREAEAQAFARRSIDTFGPLDVDALVINSAGCGTSVKDYGELLADDPAYRERAAALAERTYDIAEFLASREPVATRHRLELKVAYHDACHLAHSQGIRAEPRRLLGDIPGVELVEIADGDLCCGSAGVYNLLAPDAATELGDRKAANVAATGADLLVAANPGCTLQIAAGLRRQGTELPLAHTIEVLDASLGGHSPTSLLR
ncbi:MAG: heterodisulfide reductase-related iron-sulfur binding cluster [Actinomycetota bacterium]|nr:heterodisulfide reductase-related iron-sulfur binding cluster [Actinomycetota bacterium]